VYSISWEKADTMTLEKKENSLGKECPVEELIKLLGDADPQVREEARHRLCARAEEAVPKLMEALQAVEEDVRFEISRALTEMGETAVKAMMEVIQHADPHVRAVAARVLSLVGGETALKRLDQEARKEKRKTVRKELREAAAKIAKRLEDVKLRSQGRSAEERGEAQGRDGLSEKEREEKRLYLNIVRNLILSNWARPRSFSAETEAEEVLVTLKVDTDGSLSRVLLENKWQSSLVGESLKDAIRRSSPFPPVPEAVARGKYEIDITFILPVPS